MNGPLQPCLRVIDGAHTPEPRAGTIRTPDGHQADLFNVRHYPVAAICRACGQPIRADTFFRPFVHVEGPMGRDLPVPRPQARCPANPHPNHGGAQ